MEKFDSTDIQILNLLQQDSTLTIKEISTKINLSITPVHDRIKRLEQSKIIEKYVAILNKKKVGKGLVIYCNVTLDKQRQETFSEFNEAIKKMPEVLECSLVSGNFDYFLKIVAADMESYNTFYQSKLAVLSCVSQIHSFFVMDEVKSTTMVMV
jgi:DNA-binding Lrp family transcriptional regulator